MNDQDYYIAKVLLLSPTFDTSANDKSWHSALEAVFTYVLNPRREDSVIFKFGKATPLCYLIDGVQSQSLDSLKLFMGVSQFLEEALRNLQVQTYCAEYPRERPECRDDDYDDTPQGTRDIPRLKPDDLLWKSTKACISLEELKQRFSYMACGPNDLNPGSKMYDISWIESSSKGPEAGTETCKGPMRLGFAIHRTRLDARLLAIQREHVIKNLLHCIQFNLWLFGIASHTETAMKLTAWMDKCTRSTWGPNRRLVEYIETFVCAPKFLYRDRQPSSQMSRNFLRRIGSIVHPFPEVSESDESLDEAIGEQNTELSENIGFIKDESKLDVIAHKKTFTAYLNAQKYSSYRSICPGFDCVDEHSHLSDVSESSTNMTRPSESGAHSSGNDARKDGQVQVIPGSLVASISQVEPEGEKQYMVTAEELNCPCLGKSIESLDQTRPLERQTSILMAAHITRERKIYTLRRLIHNFSAKDLPQDTAYPEADGSTQRQETMRSHTQRNASCGFHEAGAFTQGSYYIPFDPLRDPRKVTWGWRTRNMIKKSPLAAFCSEYTYSMVEKWLQGIPLVGQLEAKLKLGGGRQNGALQHGEENITRGTSPETLNVSTLSIPDTSYWGLKLKRGFSTKTRKQSSVNHVHTCPPSPETPESSKLWVPSSPPTPSGDWTPPQLYTTSEAPSGTSPEVLDPLITHSLTQSHLSTRETSVHARISECSRELLLPHTLPPSASNLSGGSSSNVNDADFSNNTRGESLAQRECRHTIYANPRLPAQGLRQAFKRKEGEHLLDQKYEKSSSSIPRTHTSPPKWPVKGCQDLPKQRNAFPLLASLPGPSSLFQAVAEQNLALIQAYVQVEVSAARLRSAQLEAKRLLW